MRAIRTVTALAVVGASLMVLPCTAQGQGGFLNQIKQRVKDKVQQKADQTTDSVTDAAMKCVVGDSGCVQKAQADGKQVKVVDSKGQPVSSADSAKAMDAGNSAASAGPSAATVDTHNDFTPGTRIIAERDFASATVGDFPRDMELGQGNMEIASWNGKKFLRTTSYSEFDLALPEVLPQRFTLEFDFSGGWDARASFAGPNAPDGIGGEVSCSLSGEAEISPDKGAKSGSNVGDVGKLIHCQVMADSNYVKIYINGKRAGQSPNAPLGRSNKIYFKLTASDNEPAYIGNIRVAAGGRDMYEALNTDGRFTTHGILFATGSAAIDPASSATLTQIGQMLQQHADLKLEIDGHTDNVGSAASNQTLSDQRAAAVKQYLVSNFHIDASRLASKGYGASKPVAPNTTDSGRQQNRRVELVKM